MMNGKNDTGYTGYEYREITVPKEHASLCLDSYPCFGWEPDPNREADVGRSPKKVSKTLETVALYFRRPRNISNKAELTRLQRNFDSCVAELKALERDKTTPATITALIVGILGTAFYGWSHLCGSGRATHRLAEHSAGDSRFPGLDRPVFFVPGIDTEVDGEG